MNSFKKIIKVFLFCLGSIQTHCCLKTLDDCITYIADYCWCCHTSQSPCKRSAQNFLDDALLPTQILETSYTSFIRMEELFSNAHERSPVALEYTSTSSKSSSSSSKSTPVPTLKPVSSWILVSPSSRVSSSSGASSSSSEDFIDV